MSNSESSDAPRHPSLSDLKLRDAAPVDQRDCPMARASELIGDKWTMLILREALFSVGSFADMLNDLDISRAVLADRLAQLVDKRLLEKVTYQDPGARPRQAYVLTSFGRQLIVPFLALADWGQGITGKASPLQMYNTSTGKPVRLALIDPNGQEVSVTNLGVRVKSQS